MYYIGKYCKDNLGKIKNFLYRRFRSVFGVSAVIFEVVGDSLVGF